MILAYVESCPYSLLFFFSVLRGKKKKSSISLLTLRTLKKSMQPSHNFSSSGSMHSSVSYFTSKLSHQGWVFFPPALCQELLSFWIITWFTLLVLDIGRYLQHFKGRLLYAFYSLGPSDLCHTQKCSAISFAFKELIVHVCCCRQLSAQRLST